MTRAITETPSAADEVQERLAFADAALALAGHEISDPWSRGIMEQVACGEMTGDDAVAAIRRRFQG